MINSTVKYSFEQIQNGLLGFVGNIELKLREINNELPVFILQTGDFSYILDKKFTESENKEIYQKIPRFVITMDDIQYQSDQNTNPYNKVIYNFEELDYMCVARRLAITLPLTTDFVSSNLVKAFENFEIMATIVAKPNIFTYEFLGNTFEAAYVITVPSMEKPTMDIGSGTRSDSIKTSFELQLQLLVPRIESIKLLSESGYESVKYDLTVNPNSEIEQNISFNNT